MFSLLYYLSILAQDSSNVNRNFLIFSKMNDGLLRGRPTVILSGAKRSRRIRNSQWETDPSASRFQRFAQDDSTVEKLDQSDKLKFDSLGLIAGFAESIGAALRQAEDVVSTYTIVIT